MRIALCLLLAGCPGPNDDECNLPDTTPSATRALEIGQTDFFLSTAPFAPFTEGQLVERERGFQGGSHIFTRFRVPAEADDGTETRCMRVSYERTNPDGSTRNEESTYEFERVGDHWLSINSLRDEQAAGNISLNVSIVDEVFSGSQTLTLDVRESGDLEIGPRVAAAAFRPGETIPLEHRCEADGGSNTSPEIGWYDEYDSRQQSNALVLRDITDGTVLWVLYEPPGTIEAGVPEGIEPFGTDSRQAPIPTADGVFFGYQGPCSGGTGHTYEFSVHILDRLIRIVEDRPLENVVADIDEATITRGSFTAIY